MNSFSKKAILLVALLSCAFAGRTTAQTLSDSLKTVTLRIGGITCSNDCQMIASSVSRVKGVRQCQTVGKESATTAFKMQYDPRQTSEKDIQTAILNTGACEAPSERPYKVKSIL